MITKLLAYLSNHGIIAKEHNGKILALHVYTHNGYGGEEWLEVEPTFEAVRAFLNY